jgi:hypothetical protein
MRSPTAAIIVRERPLRRLSRMISILRFDFVRCFREG